MAKQKTGKRPQEIKPTEAELAILRVLWERGAATVREVHEALNAAGEKGYTTTLKLMQIMTDKGLVRRDDRARTHVYYSSDGQEKMQRRLVGDLIDRAFSGSGAGLIMQALSTRRASREELAEIRRLLDAHEREHHGEELS